MNDFNRGQLHQRLQSEQKGPSWSEVNDLCVENEQLRKENTRRYHLMSEMWAEDLQLKAEIERLRAALKKLAREADRTLLFEGAPEQLEELRAAMESSEVKEFYDG